MPRVEIDVAATHASRQAVYAFRYDVIVTEMNVPVPTADLERRVVIDPEDATAHLFAARCDGAIIGTVRVNFLRNGPVTPHSELLELDRLPAATLNATSVSSRFLVATPYRRTPVTVRLTQAWYRFCLAAGIEWDYILVKPDLVDMYARLGWRLVGTDVRHPEVGSVQALRLQLTDHDHLHAIRSPFVQRPTPKRPTVVPRS